MRWALQASAGVALKQQALKLFLSGFSSTPSRTSCGSTVQSTGQLIRSPSDTSTRHDLLALSGGGQVILETRPCWLYFDLEYSVEANPELEAKSVMDCFWETFSSFSREVMGFELDLTRVIELESSTGKKFSRHVIVKCLGGMTKALANNAQAGLLVNHLVRYAEAHREMAQLLFVQAPRKCHEVEREVCVIDESVYSRNRCFRLLFQSKCGKERRLDLEPSSTKRFWTHRPLPCVAMLETMASFVPENTELYEHQLLPVDARKPRSKVSVIRNGLGSDPLLDYLIQFWDGIRDANEPKTSHPATVAQSCAQINELKFAVTLGNNRFCFCKGSSHLSNHIYLVVDVLQASFYQKLDSELGARSSGFSLFLI